MQAQRHCGSLYSFKVIAKPETDKIASYSAETSSGRQVSIIQECQKGPPVRSCKLAGGKLACMGCHTRWRLGDPGGTEHSTPSQGRATERCRERANAGVRVRHPLSLPLSPGESEGGIWLRPLNVPAWEAGGSVRPAGDAREPGAQAGREPRSTPAANQASSEPGISFRLRFPELRLKCSSRGSYSALSWTAQFYISAQLPKSEFRLQRHQG